MSRIGFLSEAVNAVIKGIEDRVDARSVIRSALMLAPVWSIVTTLALTETTAMGELPRISLDLLIGLFSSAPFQTLGARMTADTKHLQVASPVVGFALLTIASYPFVSYLITIILSGSLHLKYHRYDIVNGGLVGLAYVLTCMVAASLEDHGWKPVLRVLVPWVTHSVTFAILRLMLTLNVAESFALSSLILIAMLSMSLITNLSHISFPEITKKHVVGILIASISSALDYFFISLSSVMYYFMIFFDKVIVWKTHGFPYPHLDIPSSLGMLSLMTGTLSAGIFWSKSSEHLNEVYNVKSDEFDNVKKSIFQHYVDGLVLSIVLSIVLALVTLMLIWQCKRSYGILKAIGPTVLKDLMIQLSSVDVGLLKMYLLGSIFGSLVIYTYPQLTTFRKEIEALASLSTVPTLELVEWNLHHDVRGVALGYLIGAAIAAVLCVLVTTRTWLNLRSELYRILSYNTFVSYVIEVYRLEGMRESE